MHARTIRVVTCGAVLAAALLTGCSGPAPTPTPSSQASTAPAVATVAPTSAPTSAAEDDVDDVNCSTSGGKVGPEGGAQVDLIAVATDAGRVGCTEAFNVITEYYRDAPTKSEGTSHRLVVQGWSCLADTGAQGSGIIGCDKDGLALRTDPS
ncbi:hypothetical protein [Pseudonocardia sp. TRM90224]|uniref:hypothetical protein n=1 Tax=Pseudonocardia sp. TRM90224 TaxID=2812678 RepID=UPI001E4D0149|nr:hypothetical protein [Pseudonocardia sp. TRM90224]